MWGSGGQKKGAIKSLLLCNTWELTARIKVKWATVLLTQPWKTELKGLWSSIKAATARATFAECTVSPQSPQVSKVQRSTATLKVNFPSHALHFLDTWINHSRPNNVFCRQQHAGESAVACTGAGKRPWLCFMCIVYNRFRKCEPVSISSKTQ